MPNPPGLKPILVAQMVRALLMTSKVPGSSPGGSGIFFSLFRQFTSLSDPLNKGFSRSFNLK